MKVCAKANEGTCSTQDLSGSTVSCPTVETYSPTRKRRNTETAAELITQRLQVKKITEDKCDQNDGLVKSSN